MSNACPILVFGIYFFILLGLGIAASSMMIYQNNNETWKNKIMSAYRSQGGGPVAMMRSWKQSPFVEIQAFDA